MKKHIFIFLFGLSLLGKAFALDLPVYEWNLATYEGAIASYSGGLVSVVAPGNDYWNVQLTHMNVQLLSEKNYEVKFKVKAIQRQRKIEVRIGRESFPYDAFAEFAEITATLSGRDVTKQFKMLSGGVPNARFEFNVGKYMGDVEISDVSITCLDCSESGTVLDPTTGTSEEGALSDRDYVIITNDLEIQDRGRVLGDVYSKKLFFGNDNKVYGNVDAGGNCAIGHNNEIQKNLRSANDCVIGSNFRAASIEKRNVKAALPETINMEYGDTPLIVRDNETFEPLPIGLANSDGDVAVYGDLTVMNNATIKISKPDAFVFSSIYTNVNTKWEIDLSEGPVAIVVKNGIRFGNGTQISVIGGPVSNLEWYVESGNISIEPESKILGRFMASECNVHVSPRSHIVGSLYANKIKFEPDVDVSGEPHLREISYNHQHFSPFFSFDQKNYKAIIPPEETEVEMYVYADDGYSYKVNGGTSTKVKLTENPEVVNITVSRPMISGFPIEAFSKTYTFEFWRRWDYQVFWNPYSSCTENCDGLTREKAIKKFTDAYNNAAAFGRELVALGGTLNIPKTLSTNEMKWKVGFEMRGEKVASSSGYPHLEFDHAAHIQIEGQSPRRIEGLVLQNGFNKESGGAISSNSDELFLKNITIFGSKSEGMGGAVYQKNKLVLNESYIHDNIALSNGGAVSAGSFDALNSVIEGNKATDNGGGLHISSGSSKIANCIFTGNETSANGGAIFNDNAVLSIWNATFFNNTASENYGGIYSGSGEIGNSIFWKNYGSCRVGDCIAELTSGYNSTHSSFTKKYGGASNYEGDPLFRDESNLAGSQKYRHYNAGLNLKASSPLVQYGVANTAVPDKDIVGIARIDKLPLGPYGYSEDYYDVVVGRIKDDGSFYVVLPVFPVIEGFPRGEKGTLDYGLINTYAASKLSRVIKVSLPYEPKYLGAFKVDVAISLLDKNGKPYTEKTEVKLPFYKKGAENGKIIFQTKTLSYGKPVIFSSVCADIGEYEGGYVLCLKDQTDQFRAVVKDIEW